ncbi:MULTISPECIES: hypothetical protein [unclassified Neptuniibacter]|uniref:hypothetical protein n=1 Tax=unclassified Neptuniibacter TaxID=2630693 RepID=UPI000C6B1D5F|nr:MULTISPECIES: hypothetical protein [unclassified Neptuniibacter]MAY43373.1 hypothetical protein [Oceanospirillaceae bacterium]|tara:strand:+ start:24187 stop:24534 length:348 start_codon:yes stop_codon:yes gene_type:complete
MSKNEGIKPLKILFTILSVILISALAVFSYALWEDVKSTELDKLYKENQTLINQSLSFFDQQTRLIVKTVQPRFIFPKLQSKAVNNIFDYLSSATDEVAVYSLIDLQGNTLLSRG